MDLILFLILGTAWLTMKVKDDVASARTTAYYTQETIRKNIWKEQVTNRNLERELKLFMERPENCQAFLDEVAEAYDSILKDRRLDELYPRSSWGKRKKGWTPEFHERAERISCQYRPTSAMRIMLAKRGFIPVDDAERPDKLRTLNLLDRHVLFWCDKKLREQGAPLSLGFTESGALKWEMKSGK